MWWGTEWTPKSSWARGGHQTHPSSQWLWETSLQGPETLSVFYSSSPLGGSVTYHMYIGKGI